MVKKVFLSVLALGVMLSFSFAQQEKAKKKPVFLIKVRSMEGITEYRMNNGLRVLLLPDSSKEVATVNVTYLVGSRQENYGETGMAHLLEHMMFKGCPKHTDIPKELTEHGARANGTTWFDRTNYYESFPATDENLEWALDLEADRMVNSFIRRKDLDSEFSVVRNEFEQGESTPMRVVFKNLYATAFHWHNYGKTTIGNKSDVENVGIPNLRAFYEMYYQPDNAVLVVTGKIDVAKTLDLIKEKFGQIAKPTRKFPAEYTVEPTQDGERSFTIRRVGGSKILGVLYRTPNGYNREFASLKVLSALLTDRPSGRLYKALVDTKKATALFYNAQETKDPGAIFFMLDIPKENDEKEVYTIFEQEIEDLAKNPITQEELDRARSKMLKEIDLYMQDTANVGTYISEFIALGDWQLMFYLRDLIKKLTPEDLNKAAGEYFIPSNSTVGWFIPTDKEPKRAVIPAPESPLQTMKGYVNKTVVKQGEEFDSSPENLKKRVHFEKDGDLHLALLSKKTRGGLVEGQMIFKIGNEKALYNKVDISQITTLLLKKGTKDKSRQEIEDLLTAYSAELSIHPKGPSQVAVEFTTKREFLPKLLDLIEEILKTPSFPQNEFDKMITNSLSGIEKNKTEPGPAAMEKMAMLTSDYPKGHPSEARSSDEVMAALKLLKRDDAVKFYKDFIGAGNAYFSVVGDFDEQEIKDKLKSQYATWKSPIKYGDIKHSDNLFKDKKINEKIITPDKQSAFYFGVFAFYMQTSSPDYLPMQLAATMFGGGFLSSRLADRLRQKDGLCYTVNDLLNVNAKDKVGNLGIIAMFNPDNLDKLELGIKEEIERARAKGFTEEELEKAKSNYRQGLKRTRAEDKQLVRVLNILMEDGENFDDYIKRSKARDAVSLDEANKAFVKYVKLENWKIVKAGDFDRKKKEEGAKNE